MMTKMERRLLRERYAIDVSIGHTDTTSDKLMETLDALDSAEERIVALRTALERARSYIFNTSFGGNTNLSANVLERIDAAISRNNT